MAKKSVNAAVVVVNQDATGDRAFDSEDVFANFKTPTSGTVDFSGASTSAAVSGNNIVQAYNSGSSFNYDFTISSDYELDLSYSASETDNFYPDNYLQVINVNGGPPLFNINPADGGYGNPTIGSASVFLTPGSYELGITSKLGDISEVQGASYSAGGHIEQYAFNLTAAVPEVSTWFMMILGLGMIGGVMRRAYRKSEERFTNEVRSLAAA